MSKQNIRLVERVTRVIERLAAESSRNGRHELPSVHEIVRVCLAEDIPATPSLATMCRRDVMRTVSRQDGIPVPGTHGGGGRLIEVTPSAQTLLAASQANALVVRRMAEIERTRKVQEEIMQQAQQIVDIVTQGQPEKPMSEEKPEVVVEDKPVSQVVAEKMFEAHARPAPPPKRPRRGAALRAEKREFINELLDEQPGMPPQIIMGKLFERFGSGIDTEYLYRGWHITDAHYPARTLCGRSRNHVHAVLVHSKSDIESAAFDQFCGACRRAFARAQPQKRRRTKRHVPCAHVFSGGLAHACTQHDGSRLCGDTITPEAICTKCHRKGPTQLLSAVTCERCLVLADEMLAEGLLVIDASGMMLDLTNPENDHG